MMLGAAAGGFEEEQDRRLPLWNKGADESKGAADEDCRNRGNVQRG